MKNKPKDDQDSEATNATPEPTDAELIARRNAALRDAGIVDLRTVTPALTEESDFDAE